MLPARSCEAAPPEILTFHPLIQTIGIETLRILVEEPEMIVDRHEEVKEILSNVLEYEDAEAYESQTDVCFFRDRTKSRTP